MLGNFQSREGIVSSIVIMEEEAPKAWKDDLLSARETVVWSADWQSRDINPIDSIEGSMEHLPESGSKEIVSGLKISYRSTKRQH